eukprot:TRINITY_DN8880_c0_g1_i1.p1 TRINITY_DN8880_c0_g1~~TRINITY_DN8880_c0_g1_i1.p1  ORF type:complete len:263 (+),score=50.94 TRINITY_DN8880_c0_g1_i1:145-933(+)
MDPRFDNAFSAHGRAQRQTPYDRPMQRPPPSFPSQMPPYAPSNRGGFAHHRGAMHNPPPPHFAGSMQTPYTHHTTNPHRGAHGGYNTHHGQSQRAYPQHNQHNQHNQHGQFNQRNQHNQHNQHGQFNQRNQHNQHNQHGQFNQRNQYSNRGGFNSHGPRNAYSSHGGNEHPFFKKSFCQNPWLALMTSAEIDAESHTSETSKHTISAVASPSITPQQTSPPTKDVEIESAPTIASNPEVIQLDDDRPASHDSHPDDFIPFNA